MSRMHRRAPFLVLAGAATLVLAASVMAHVGHLGAAVDLDPMEQYAAARVAATATPVTKEEKAVHKAWRVLDRALLRANRNLSGDLADLALASKDANNLKLP